MTICRHLIKTQRLWVQMFADIAGFTAWSSEREPFQVFQLLETVYAGFDAIAKRLSVFKMKPLVIVTWR